MAADSENLDLNLDTETLLRRKIDYHKEQAKYHLRLAKETKDKLKLLTGVSEEKASETEPEKRDNVAFINFGLSDDFRLKIWRQKVLDVLKNNPQLQLTSSDILEKIDVRYTRDEDKRRKAIGVISNALHGLVKNAIVTVYTNYGRGNKYGIKNPQSVVNGGS